MSSSLYDTFYFHDIGMEPMSSSSIGTSSPFKCGGVEVVGLRPSVCVSHQSINNNINILDGVWGHEIKTH